MRSESLLAFHSVHLLNGAGNARASCKYKNTRTSGVVSVYGKNTLDVAPVTIRHVVRLLFAGLGVEVADGGARGRGAGGRARW